LVPGHKLLIEGILLRRQQVQERDVPLVAGSSAKVRVSLASYAGTSEGRGEELGWRQDGQSSDVDHGQMNQPDIYGSRT
jgi:hypothetical protein